MKFKFLKLSSILFILAISTTGCYVKIEGVNLHRQKKQSLTFKQLPLDIQKKFLSFRLEEVTPGDTTQPYPSYIEAFNFDSNLVQLKFKDFRSSFPLYKGKKVFTIGTKKFTLKSNVHQERCPFILKNKKLYYLNSLLGSNQVRGYDPLELKEANFEYIELAKYLDY
ncbi:MAG TPA: hypothetical protein DCS93_21800 [Microscillaceae bacterium]|nr:hypothetical protein [Microscillaceae bacterium]